MAGLAFTCAGVGIVHALAHSIGAKYGTHHGMTNAVFLPHGLEFNNEIVAYKYAYAARHLGISKSADATEAAGALIRAVIELTRECGLPLRLKDLGVPEISESD